MRQGLFLVPPDTAQCNPESATRPGSPTARDFMCATPCSTGCCTRWRRAIPTCGAAFSMSPACRSRRRGGKRKASSFSGALPDRPGPAGRAGLLQREQRSVNTEDAERPLSAHIICLFLLSLLRKGWTGGGTRNRPLSHTLSHTRIMSHGPLTSFAAIGYNMLVWRD